MTGLKFYTNGHIMTKADSMNQKLITLAQQYDTSSAAVIMDMNIKPRYCHRYLTCLTTSSKIMLRAAVVILNQHFKYEFKN